jgi:hypothetical protein
VHLKKGGFRGFAASAVMNTLPPPRARRCSHERARFEAELRAGLQALGLALDDAQGACWTTWPCCRSGTRSTT